MIPARTRPDAEGGTGRATWSPLVLGKRIRHDRRDRARAECPGRVHELEHLERRSRRDEPAHGPLTIGASLSLTGDFSADGQAFERGYQLWAKDVNAHGGILGRTVKLTILNDGSSPNQVVTN